MRHVSYRLRIGPILAALLCGGAIAAADPPAMAQSPCTCRAAGTSFALDACTCLKTPDGPRLACCGKVLNNTAWLFKDLGCPTAQAPGLVPQPRAITNAPDSRVVGPVLAQTRWQTAPSAN